MRLFFTAFIFLSLFNSLYAEDLIDYDYESDIYYSNVSAFIDLDSDNELCDASDYSEAKIYTDLILNTFSPNIFLVEAAIHPMPIAGLYFRNNNPNLYDRSKVQNMNLVKIVTAGFAEPYSLSFFLGRMLVFKNKNNGRIGKNRAYMGYLVTIGDYTIKENTAYYDKWMNIEFKLKGTREKENRDLDWSFRIGSRIHQNKDFVNTVFIGARRSSIDYNKGIYSLLYNSAFSTMISLSAENLNLAETEVMIEKKFPLKWSKKMSFGVAVGYIYNSGEKYRGTLKDEGVDNHQMIFRPNLNW